ncbi:MAG: 5-(carboxyamino)imidazole ribonucleotide synthase [Methanobrevibacter sp.]|nr:5-(carboxyamino)imidazole ribonucleotide synthase [Methanobrevibacter sp.]
MQPFLNDLKLGIIAGGQLGKMLIQEASKWNIKTYILEEDINSPASSIATHHVQGSRFDFEAVYNFGKEVDLLTFEIESINIDALFKLKEEGLKISPDPSILKLFQDKEKQKEFYVASELPTSPFKSYDNKEDIIDALGDESLKYPFVQKLKTGGYDGRGVSVINSESDLKDLLNGESIVEQKIDIHKEIGVIVARNEKGEIKSFPAAEMVFDPKANLVEQLICPADISEAQHIQSQEIAHKLIERLDMCGLLAIEFFIDANGDLLINESAPRTHNSGHHTIESIVTSQFEQHLRAILNLPLGSTDIKLPAVMINLLGEAEYHGKAVYEGFDECLAIDGVKIHLYGKTITKPYRKMGHITVIDKDLNKALEKTVIVKNTIKVIADK